MSHELNNFFRGLASLGIVSSRAEPPAYAKYWVEWLAAKCAPLRLPTLLTEIWLRFPTRDEHGTIDPLATILYEVGDSYLLTALLPNRYGVTSYPDQLLPIGDFEGGTVFVELTTASVLSPMLWIRQRVEDSYKSIGDLEYAIRCSVGLTDQVDFSAEYFDPPNLPARFQDRFLDPLRYEPTSVSLDQVGTSSQERYVRTTGIVGAGGFLTEHRDGPPSLLLTNEAWLRRIAPGTRVEVEGIVDGRPIPFWPQDEAGEIPRMQLESMRALP